MNSAVIILGAIVLVPVIILMVLRINAALVFLSLCLGDVLIQFVAGDGTSLSKLFPASHQAHLPANGSPTLKLILLLLPVILTAIFMIKTVKGTRLLLNFLPALGVGLLGALLVVPLLSVGLSHNIIDSSVWAHAKRAQEAIVGGSAAVCLAMLWLHRPKAAGHEKHGKHHHE
jgi:hypothetical protein